jgi:class 3 adenylate cyclase
MPPLGAKERAKLPDSAFAYIDSQGRRRLPINDESHVRNALSRFAQTDFEDDTARDKARTRLLRAAKKYGIVPIGFVSAELQPQRKLPTGLVTLLMTDVEGSTELLHQLDDRYGALLAQLRRLQRSAVKRAGGREVDARGDEFFAAFERASSAVEAAVAIQRKLGEQAWPDGVDVRVRIGIHHGRPKLTESGYVGLAVNAVARVCDAAHGGQIVVSSSAQKAASKEPGEGIALTSLGRWKLRGFPEGEALYRVAAEGLVSAFPAVRAEAVGG